MELQRAAENRRLKKAAWESLKEKMGAAKREYEQADAEYREVEKKFFDAEVKESRAPTNT